MAVPTPVNGQITDAVTQANITVLAQAPAMAMGSLYQAQANALSILFANSVDAQAKLADSFEAITDERT
ncbi:MULTISPECIES: RebB family R body protein [Kordiimonas]|uniref:RebB family R body protein n=1 Tax=Kordiimonas TaxID=288021 RepID=UPI001FF1E29F|nr:MULTISPECIES: RebB family R body protein [Kordiimonas]MCK0069632.1 RebB family R body protein [Kordiimonas laminariae]UTW57096.1 RebB family R body protein [Kordiimonas sp. SCSIO 12603]